MKIINLCKKYRHMLLIFSDIAIVIWNMSDSILEEVKTNLDVKECMGIASDVLGNSSKYLNNIVSKQVPSESEGKGQTIDKIYYFVCDLPTVSKELKNILYNN